MTLLELVWDSVPALMFYKDTHNNLLKVNEYFCKLLGGEKTDYENKGMLELMEDQVQAARYAKNDLTVFKTGKSKIGIEEKLFDTNITVRTDKFPIKDNEDNVIGVLGLSVVIDK
jgi:PAS domain S-box-containing protein